MTADRIFDHGLEAVTTAVNHITTFDVDDLPLDLDELGEAWLTLDTAYRRLGVIVNDLAVNVGTKLADMPYETKEGYRLPSGELVHHEQRSTTRWQGRRLLQDLSTVMIDPDSGETMAAIPTDVLLDVVPGTATDKQTSSSWRIGGLQNLGVDPDVYRSREWKQPVVRKGPGR